MTNLAEGGRYVLSFQNPTTLAFRASSSISVDATEKDMKNAVESYYTSTFAAHVDITRKSYDADGKMVEAELADRDVKVKPVVVKRVYEIALTRLITGVSASTIQVAKIDTKANV